VRLRWVNNNPDDPHDLCAHGDVEFRIGGDVLLDGSKGRDLTVSAAALYLLRTLLVPHTKAAPLGDHLFPCCGFSMYDEPGEEDVVICGCPNGEDFEILHRLNGSGVLVRGKDGREWELTWPEWTAAIFGFADRVSEFFAASTPKQPHDEVDTAGFRKFMAEWARRRGKQLGVIDTERH